MSRSWLTWCCAALSCFPASLVRPMTVSPIVFFTSTPSPIDSSNYYYYGGGGGGGRGASNGLYRGGSRETAAVAAYGYRHRTTPASNEAKVRVGRHEPNHALYESPHTYEYMTNPTKKGGRVRQHGARVPKTEQRPPGDDVEYLVDARPRVKGPGNRHSSAGGRYDAGDDDDDGSHRYHREKKRKRKRKSPSATTSARTAEPEMGSSSKKNVREGIVKVRDDGVRPVYEKKTPVKKNSAGGGTDAGNEVKNIREREELIDDSNAQVKHKIRKKNEYSKKQQFFDEEHVDHGKKKPISSQDRNNKGHKKRAGHDNSSKNRKRRVMKDNKKDSGNSKHVKQKSSQGYGHILAVR